MRPPLAAVALAGALAAQDKELEQVFQRYDTSKDGQVVRAEFPGSDEQFAAMDKDKNQKVTLAEFLASPVARRMLVARDKDAAPPRARIATDERWDERFLQLARFDLNRDGRITREEWQGAATGFLALDLDGNGVLDSADKALAEKRSAESGEPALKLPGEMKTGLPAPEELIKRLDVNKDQKLSKAEVGTHKLAQLFDTADTNRDGSLDEEELRRIVMRVAYTVDERNKGYEKARPFGVPFDAWDKNKDERLDTNEFVERKELFARIDRNKDSVITRDEIVRYEKSVTGDTFVERFDLSGDGRVTLEEFGGPVDVFRRLDLNGDGVITAADR